MTTAERHIKRKHLAYVRGDDGKLREAKRSEIVGGSAVSAEIQRLADGLVPRHLKGLAFNVLGDGGGCGRKPPMMKGGGKRGAAAAAAPSRLQPLRRVFPCEACNHVSLSFMEARRHRKYHMESPMSEGSGSEEEKERLAGGGRRYLRSHKKALRGRRELGFRSVATAHSRQLQRFRYIFPPRVHFLEAAFAHVFPRLSQLLRLELAANRGRNLKCTVVMNVEMVQINDQAEIEEEMEVPFRGGMRIIRSAADISPAMEVWMERIDALLDAFIKRGSGWTLNDVNYLDVELFQVAPLQGACHLHSVDYKMGTSRFADPPLPLPRLANVGKLRTIVLGAANVKEASDPRLTDCFYLAVARAYLGADRYEQTRVRNRFILDELNHFNKRRGLPMRECDIGGFEDAHDHLKLAINVLYQNAEGDIFPLRASPNNIRSDYNVIVMMLRYFQDASSVGLEVEAYAKKKKKMRSEEVKDKGEEKQTESVGHYAYVEDPSSLLACRRGRRRGGGKEGEGGGGGGGGEERTPIAQEEEDEEEEEEEEEEGRRRRERG
jgi:hypothetical protein